VRICLMCIDCEGVIFLTVQTGGQDAWAMVDEDAWALVKKKKKRKKEKKGCLDAWALVAYPTSSGAYRLETEL
jgi:hypothetical protein